MNKNKAIGKRMLAFALIIFTVGTAFFAGCSKIDDTYKDFIKDGERIYMGRVDSLKARSGLNRVELSWLAISDRRVVKATVFWNNRTSSKDVPIHKTAGIDSISVMLTDMPEENYSFEVITYDSLKNFSMPVAITARVYGEQYVNSLYNRPILSTKYKNSTLTIKWDAAGSGTVVTHLEYIDNSALPHTIEVSADEEQTVLSDFKKGSSFNYRTVYVPEPFALDTIYTPFEVVE